MVDLQSFGLFVSFWAVLYLADILLRSSSLTTRSYTAFMENNGFSIHPGQVRWYTQRFNRLFIKLGQSSPGIAEIWFDVGVVFGLVAQVLAIVLLAYVVYQTVAPQSSEEAGSSDQDKVLTPVMPGVNLPTSELGYYLLTLFVCGVLHEAGHAIAAVREQVKVHGFGMFFFAIYPGAFVDLHTEQLNSVSPFRQLRIFCAGIWHNFMIVVAALAFLMALPSLMAPLYATGRGAVVTHVVENSPVSGPRGLHAGELLTRVDLCYVTNSQTWLACVQRAYTGGQLGYCIGKDRVRLQDTSKSRNRQAASHDCCDADSPTHLCFKLHGHAMYEKSACLPARQVTASRAHCRMTAHCPLSQACAVPATDNATRLLKITHGTKAPLLFIGHQADLVYSVATGDYAPRWRVIPLTLPYTLYTFCRYLVSLSGALVVLNVVPCYALDGQWILHGFVELAFGKVFSRDVRLHIFSMVLLFGTLLLSVNIIIALWTLFMR